MSYNKDPYNKKAKWIIGIVAACIIIYLGLQNVGVVAEAFSWLLNLIMPLVLGLIFALILNMPMTFFERHLFTKSKKKFLNNIRKPLACLLSFVAIFGIIVGLVVLVIPELVNAIKLIVKSIVDVASKVNTMDTKELPFSSILQEFDWKSTISTLEKWLKEESGYIMNTAFGTIGSLIGGIVDFFIAIIFSIYILFNKRMLKIQITRLIKAWLPQKSGSWLIHAAQVSSKVFRNFVSGQTLEGVILGTLCIIGMLILGIPYAPMVGALVGVTALIPVVGAFIGAIVGAFIIFTVSPIKALVFIIFLIILQQLEGNLIYPKVMSSRINLPAMWVLAAVTIGGGLAGALGMLIGVPAMSVIYVLVKEATESREKKLSETSQTEDSNAQ